MNARISHSTLRIASQSISPAHGSAVPGSVHPDAVPERSLTSAAKEPATFQVADFLHGAGTLALMERSRGLNCARKIKASRSNRATFLARACSIFLTIERSDATRGLPSSRSDVGIKVLMAQVDHVMRQFWAGSSYPPLPPPRAFRRALRDYERAVREASALLDLMLAIR